MSGWDMAYRPHMGEIMVYVLGRRKWVMIIPTVHNVRSCIQWFKPRLPVYIYPSVPAEKDFKDYPNMFFLSGTSSI